MLTSFLVCIHLGVILNINSIQIHFLALCLEVDPNYNKGFGHWKLASRY